MIRVTLGSYEHGDVVIDVRPSELRNHVRGAPCPKCGGRGLVGAELERCQPCQATGIAANFIDRRRPR